MRSVHPFVAGQRTGTQASCLVTRVVIREPNEPSGVANARDGLALREERELRKAEIRTCGPGKPLTTLGGRQG